SYPHSCHRCGSSGSLPPLLPLLNHLVVVLVNGHCSRGHCHPATVTVSPSLHLSLLTACTNAHPAVPRHCARLGLTPGCGCGYLGSTCNGGTGSDNSNDEGERPQPLRSATINLKRVKIKRTVSKETKATLWGKGALVESVRVEANFENNPDEGDDHDNILRNEKQEENRSGDPASVIQGVYLK
ncbi:hypothetical protein EDB89DRAFT_2005110, partial [Lactarius sanguifluus]